MNPQASRARRPQFIPIPPSQKLKFIKAPKTSSTENPIQQVSNTPEIVQKGQATPKPASTPPKTEQEMLKESTHGKQATAEHPKRKRDTESDSASKRSKTEREMWEEFQQGKKTTAESSKCKRETEPEAPSKGPNPEEKFVRDFVRWPKTEAEKWRDFREGIGPKPVISQEPATPRGNRYNDSKEALLDKVRPAELKPRPKKIVFLPVPKPKLKFCRKTLDQAGPRHPALP